MAVKTVTLYTRQNDKTLRQLERDGRIINHRAMSPKCIST